MSGSTEPTQESTAEALHRRDAALAMLAYLLPAPGKPFPPSRRREWLEIVDRMLEYLYG